MMIHFFQKLEGANQGTPTYSLYGYPELYKRHRSLLS
jgi:hypothetical protein